MRNVIALACLCVFTTASIAQAGSVEIRFDFGASTLNFLGQVTIPPQGSITSMGATAVLPAIQTTGGATVVQTGNAALKSLTLDSTMNAGAPPFAHVTGTILASQLGTSTGSFTNTQTAMFGTPGLTYFLSVHLDCTGFACSSAGDFPISMTGNQPPATGQPFSLFFADLNTPGAADLTGTLPIYFPPGSPGGDPFTGSAQLVGTEVSRTFIPEPSFPAMLLSGLAGLAGLSLHRRRRGGISQ